MTKILDLGFWINGVHILWGWEKQEGRAGFYLLTYFLIEI